MATYLGRPVEVIEDYGNGITRVKFLDCGKPRMVRHAGESAEEYVSRIESHGIIDVATDRIMKENGNVTAWADGFGVWHVRVSRHAAGPLIAARRALRDELTARENNVARDVWMRPERVPALDTEYTIVYREGMTGRAL